jgi:Cu(I)/Ag(I) efflux system membrane fusion protein
LLLLVLLVLLLGLMALGGYWLGQRHAAHMNMGATAGASAGMGAAMSAGMGAAMSAGATSGAGAAGSAMADGKKVLYWYDPMVPTQKFDKPGKSPFMDMQLVPRYADEGGDDNSRLTISTRASQTLGLRLAKVEQGNMASQIELIGSIGFNERDISIVQTRTAGFVEHVYHHAVGDVVAAGAPLADVLNPEWAGAQQEYLAVRQIGDVNLARAARERLRLLGMNDGIISRVEQAGFPIPLDTIRSPNGGVITELMVRQGMNLASGMTLARINGLHTVWLELALPEAQAGQVALGQSVSARLPALNDAELQGKISTILPDANRETRTLRVRIELPNPGQRLRAGMLAHAHIHGPGQNGLSVPIDAVIRTGKRALVYLAVDAADKSNKSDKAGQYQPVEVRIGREANGRIEILGGLQAGQSVVASGQFLLDSEASLRGIMQASGSPASAEPATYDGVGVIDEIGADSLMLSHEPIPALKWPSMTMEFKKAPKLDLKGFKPKDKIRFQMRQKGDQFEVLGMERLPASGAASAKASAMMPAASATPATPGAKAP